MRRNENGFTILELVVAGALIAIIGSGASMTTFQIFQVSERNQDHITAVCHAQDAGRWLSHDAQMAEGVFTEDLVYPNFLQLSWTEHDYVGEDSTYHTVTYFFSDMTGGVGQLKRYHWSSAGISQNTLVAKYIYYDSGDPDNTSQASYQSPELTVKLTTLSGEVMESREYRVVRRTSLN